jgi:hypothetical protein
MHNQTHILSYQNLNFLSVCMTVQLYLHNTLPPGNHGKAQYPAPYFRDHNFEENRLFSIGILRAHVWFCRFLRKTRKYQIRRLHELSSWSYP